MATWFDTFPIIHTERLLLRQPVQADARALFAVWGDADVMRFISFGTLPDLAAAQKLLAEWEEEYARQESIWWAVCKSDDPATLIGTFCYIETLNPHHYAEIGYILGKAYWRQAYTEEGVQALIRFGFGQMRLNRIEARVMVGNDKSVRLLEKLGFTLEGILRERRFAQGRFIDYNLLSLLRRDYPQPP